ncbi:hypothetical protein CRE_00088 [Caenorhabditis remanei]|uniref:Uncharacterized protein n=1 Tax=Caenorhabditis remanei TaxID=31234 RepID=E3LD38_CAERE|nr:hypothetical protein CRE_00088 [Caenorhabditis remanei]
MSDKPKVDLRWRKIKEHTWEEKTPQTRNDPASVGTPGTSDKPVIETQTGPATDTNQKPVTNNASNLVKTMFHLRTKEKKEEAVLEFSQI